MSRYVFHGLAAGCVVNILNFVCCELMRYFTSLPEELYQRVTLFIFLASLYAFAVGWIWASLLLEQTKQHSSGFPLFPLEMTTDEVWEAIKDYNIYENKEEFKKERAEFEKEYSKPKG